MRIASRSSFFLSIAAASVVCAVISLSIFGLRPGMDFTGGSLLDITLTQSVTPDQLKTALADDTVTVTPVSDARYLLKFPYSDTEATKDALLEKVRTLAPATINEFTTLGPSASANLKEKALRAITYALIGIVLYIAATFRNRKEHSLTPYVVSGSAITLIALISEFAVQSVAAVWGGFACSILAFILFLVFEFRTKSQSLSYGIAAILALLHDVLVLIGIYAAIAHFTHMEFDLLIVTALLVLLGYSVNDTIVVFDRLREQLKFQKTGESFTMVAERALHQTIGRSVASSFTVLLTLVALLVFGPDSIRHFLVALTIGVVSGTFSSIFVATPLLVLWHEKLKKAA